MNIRRTQLLIAVSGLFCITVLLGCQSSSSRLAERKEAHAAEYAALTPEERTSVDRGALREGMRPDAVVIAWGQPSIVSTNGEFIIWEYYTKRIVIAPPTQTQTWGPWSSPPVMDTQRAQVRSYHTTSATYSAPPNRPPAGMRETLDGTAVFQHDRLLSWSPK